MGGYHQNTLCPCMKIPYWNPTLGINKIHADVNVPSVICHMKILSGYGYPQSSELRNSYMELSHYVVICLSKDSTVFYSLSIVSHNYLDWFLPVSERWSVLHSRSSFRFHTPKSLPPESQTSSLRRTVRHCKIDWKCIISLKILAFAVPRFSIMSSSSFKALPVIGSLFGFWLSVL